MLFHLDTDHVGGLQLVQNAKKIIISSEELQATQKFNIRYHHNLWQHTKIEPFEYVTSPLGKSYGLFNDERYSYNYCNSRPFRWIIIGLDN